MSLSNIQIAWFVLIPGPIEQLQKAANQNQGGNLAYCELAKGIIEARNALFLSLAIGAIAAIGASYTFDEASKMASYTYMTLATSGLTIAALAGTKLFHDALRIKALLKISPKEATQQLPLRHIPKDAERISNLDSPRNRI